MSDPKGRREFLKEVGAAAGLTAFAGLPVEGATAQGAGPAFGLPLASTRILQNEVKQENNRKEYKVALELTGSNGVRQVFDGVQRETESGTSTERVTVIRTRVYASATDSTPSETSVRTIIADIKKGEVQGDYRLDEVSLTIVDDSGVRTMPRMTVKKPLQDPYAGLSDQEKVDKILADKFRARQK